MWVLEQEFVAPWIKQTSFTWRWEAASDYHSSIPKNALLIETLLDAIKDER